MADPLTALASALTGQPTRQRAEARTEHLAWILRANWNHIIQAYVMKNRSMIIHRVLKDKLRDTRDILATSL